MKKVHGEVAKVRKAEPLLHIIDKWANTFPEPDLSKVYVQMK